MLKSVLTAIGGVALAMLPTVAAGETLVLAADHYLDVGAGKLVSPAIILVEDDRIAAINPRELPRQHRRIDLPGMTLAPGLIDAHTHLTMDLGRDSEFSGVTRTAGDFTITGVINAEKTLMAGFTTVRDLGAPAFSDVALASAVDAGRLKGPQIIAAAHATGITGGHCDVTGLAPGILEASPATGVGDGPDELVKAIRYQIKHGAKVVKICATSGVLSHEATVGAQQPTFAELKAAADEAHRHDLKIAAHAVGEAGIIAAADAGIDSLEHASILTPRGVAAIKRNNSYVVHTLYLFEAIDPNNLPPHFRKKGESIRESTFASFKTALAAGLKLAFGTDAGVFPHGDNAKELATRVRLGQSPADAVRSATVNASDLLGLSDRGALRAGLRADIIAVPGDPLADISRFSDVRFVMKAGRVYKQP